MEQSSYMRVTDTNRKSLKKPKKNFNSIQLLKQKQTCFTAYFSAPMDEISNHKWFMQHAW